MENPTWTGRSKMLRWPILIVLAVAVSKTVAFQDFMCQRQQQRLQRERRRTPQWRIREKQGIKAPSSFRLYSSIQDRSTDLEEKARTILLEPPFMVSRRFAATSMATTAASMLFSVPAVAIEGDEEGADVTVTPIGDSSQTSTVKEDALLDAPVTKEKTIEYNVQDFTVALPANWKVITKYDEKATKPPSTPTLFSAIDFNSGAVISVVREEACSVTDYAKSSFEKSSKKNAKKCDFVLKTTEEGNPMNLFSNETYEKDASKLLIRHDDRDNAVLRGVSNINESKLVEKGGLRRFPPDFLPVSGDSDSTRTDSYSSSLLELSATTTIPTSGTYRDTMGIEQPNTIDRKVLAKAVATTTRITQKVDVTTEVVPSSASESRLLASETEEGESSTETTETELLASTKSDPDVGTSTVESPQTADISGADSETSPSSISNQKVMTSDTSKEVESSPENSGATEASEENSFENSREETTVMAKISTEPESALEDDENTVSSTLSESVEENMAKVSMTTEETNTANMERSETTDSFQENTLTATNSPMASMMAMLATTDDQIDSDESSSAESSRNSISANEIEKAVEAAMEKAMETAIEAVKENTIEPTIEAVMETAKETAKEMALEMLTGNSETETQNSEATTASSSDLTTDESSPEESEAVASADKSSAIALDVPTPVYDEALVSSASPIENSAMNEPLAAPTVMSTTTTTVLSIWLSAPSDEWQKPVMGTRLNQIWESVQYTTDIIEGTDNLAMLPDDDDSMNTQLLLMNNKSFR